MTKKDIMESGKSIPDQSRNVGVPAQSSSESENGFTVGVNVLGIILIGVLIYVNKHKKGIKSIQCSSVAVSLKWQQILNIYFLRFQA